MAVMGAESTGPGHVQARDGRREAWADEKLRFKPKDREENSLVQAELELARSEVQVLGTYSPADARRDLRVSSRGQ